MTASSAFSISWSLLAWGGLLAALVLVGRDQRASGAAPGRHLYRGLAVAGFAVTWTFMIGMTLADIARYPDFATWNLRSNLFFDAYRRVTDTAPAWWWSQHLLLWAPALVLFFQAEARSRGRAHWPYIWVGLCVAVSVAFPLFLTRLEADEPQPRTPYATSWWSAVCLLVSAAAAALLPIVETRDFLATIFFVHVAVLLSPWPVLPGWASVRATRVVYLAIGGIAAVSWWGTLLMLWLSGSAPLWQVLWADPAQSSIGLDVVVTTLICCVWVARSEDWRAGLKFLASTAAFSLGGAFCLRELRR